MLTGEAYSDAMEARVFQPLGMRRTTLRPTMAMTWPLAQGHGLQSYSWPGNVRELQNVIERSVIVCDSENFSVDKSWLALESAQTGLASQTLSKMTVAQEKRVIEAALVETRGRISGPSDAAARLGIPPSKLESKTRSLKISKYRFKSA